MKKKKHPITIGGKLNALTMYENLKTVICIISFSGFAITIFQYQKSLATNYLLYVLFFISMAIANRYLWRLAKYVDDSDCDDWKPCFKALIWYSVMMALFIGAVSATF